MDTFKKKKQEKNTKKTNTASRLFIIQIISGKTAWESF